MYALKASYFTESYTYIDTVYDSFFVGCLKCDTFHGIIVAISPWIRDVYSNLDCYIWTSLKCV